MRQPISRRNLGTLRLPVTFIRNMRRLAYILGLTIGGLARVLLYLWAVLWIVWLGVALHYRWWDTSSFLSLLLVLLLLPGCFFVMLWLVTRRSRQLL